jgi:hypothetical protein
MKVVKRLLSGLAAVVVLVIIAAAVFGNNQDLAGGGAATTTSGTTGTAATTRTQTASVEQPGSYSHATDNAFCSTHNCIANFPHGSGSIVRCADGTWSHSGGLPGACSDHGGEVGG